MRLPIELIESIVEHLSDDATSLKSCSVAAPAFLATSRRQLFATLKISPPPSGTKAQQLSIPKKMHQLLTESPYLSKYITTVHLEDAGQMVEGDNGRCDHWLATDKHIALLLPLLPAVKTLVWRNGYCGLKWYSLPMDVREAFQSALMQWPLLHFEITATVDFPISLLTTMSSLQHLSLGHFHFVQGICEDMGRLGRRFPSLKSLSVVDPCRHLLFSLADWLVGEDGDGGAIDLSSLQELTFKTYDGYFPKGEDMAVVSRILQISSSSIRKLAIAPALEGITPAIVPSLFLPSHEYRELDTLSLGFELPDLESARRSPSFSFLWMKSSLENIPSTNRLRSVELRCHILQANPIADFDDVIWKELAALLSSKMFSYLEVVTLQVFYVYSETRASMPSFSGLILASMAILGERVELRVF